MDLDLETFLESRASSYQSCQTCKRLSPEALDAVNRVMRKHEEKGMPAPIAAMADWLKARGEYSSDNSLANHRRNGHHRGD